MISFQTASATNTDSINVLLENEKLPLIEASETQYLFKAQDSDGKAIGAIGLEVYGTFGLLRSLVVDPEFRNKNIAGQLVDHIVKKATGLGLIELYLLTTTAEKYFLKKRFEPILRSLVPEEIKTSKEYSTLCEKTAVVMRKKLI